MTWKNHKVDRHAFDECVRQINRQFRTFLKVKMYYRIAPNETSNISNMIYSNKQLVANWQKSLYIYEEKTISFIAELTRKMENRKRNLTTDNSERKVEQLQRKALAEQEKRKRPGECLKVCAANHILCHIQRWSTLTHFYSVQYIRTIIDRQLAADKIGSKILSNLATIDGKYELQAVPVPRTIFWQRSIQQTFVTADNCVSNFGC